MIRDVLSSIDGVGIYPLISLMLCVAVFAGVSLWAWFANRDYLDHMKHLPLEKADFHASEGEQENG